MSMTIEETREDRIFRRIETTAGIVGDLITEIETLQREIRAEEAGAATKSEKKLAELRVWLKRAYELEDLHNERTGRVRGCAGELDLAGARASIGGRLARLRAAGGAGAVSGQSE
ncbi:hypothetical protein [Donghicola mangrovi]|uniref:hypothetical protein n=1 Tax=Donghicola mangrovi TaxID=2729614 RepID=UPI001D14B5ED|nr:hypothetical protein [Donghicola mangrovi]